MAKEKSTIYKSDVEELYDRNRKLMFDLVDFATRNEAEITVRIDSRGVMSMKIFEPTDGVAYYKEITQDMKSIKYEEIQQRM